MNELKSEKVNFTIGKESDKARETNDSSVDALACDVSCFLHVALTSVHDTPSRPPPFTNGCLPRQVCRILSSQPQYGVYCVLGTGNFAWRYISFYTGKLQLGIGARHCKISSRIIDRLLLPQFKIPGSSSFFFAVMSSRRNDVDDGAGNDGVGTREEETLGQETTFEVTRTWDDLEEVDGNITVTSISEAEKRKR